MRPGVRLAIDVGTVRIGVARSDALGMLASPLETVQRGDGDVERIVAIAKEEGAIDVYVGLPVALSGRSTASTDDAVEFARRIALQLPGIVRLIDERLTTASAYGQLRASGRNSKRGRAVVDQIAATIILEHALETERRGGVRPGAEVLDSSDGRESGR